MSNLNKLDRRKFLAHSAAFFAAANVSAGCKADAMRRKPIPGTDESLPVVGLGAPDIFSRLPEQGKALPMAVIQAMIDMGGTVIDTPPFFQSGMPVIGQVLDEMQIQDELFLTGKITVSGKQEGIRHLEKTVANLNKRPIDLLMVHNMRDMRNHWPTLKDWKAAGKVRYIGVSRTRTTDFSALEKFMKSEKPDFIMTGYSISQPLAAERVLPLAADTGIAVIGAEAFKSANDGAFFGLVAGQTLPEWVGEFDCESWAQFSLKYILSHPAMTCVVTETSKVKHVIDNMGAGFGRLPDEQTRQRMSAYLLSL